jgi:hypothetical protein
VGLRGGSQCARRIIDGRIIVGDWEEVPSLTSEVRVVPMALADS